MCYENKSSSCYRDSIYDLSEKSVFSKATKTRMLGILIIRRGSFYSSRSLWQYFSLFCFNNCTF